MDLPRPEVTVTDPRSPGPLVPAQVPDPPRLGRRGAARLAVAALVAVGTLVAADVVRDRNDGVEQRRLDGVVAVTLGAPSGQWSSAHDAGTGTGRVLGVVRLVNGGRRDVRVLAAELGALRAEHPRTLAAGQEGTLVLQRTVRCPGDGGPPPPEPEVGPLRLTLQVPAGRREVVLEGDGLPRGSLDQQVQRACLHPPLGESVQLASTVVRAEDRAVALQVSVANSGRVPVRLLSLVPARGLVVQSLAGDAVGLPILLPPRTGRFPTVQTLQVRLGVICGALLGADLLRPFEELSAIVEDENRSQITSVVAITRDPDRQLRQLAGRTCSSG